MQKIKSQEIQGDPSQEHATEPSGSLRPAEAVGVAGLPSRVPHVHTDHCPRPCSETFERTDLEKDIEKGVLWQSVIVAVHRIGEYAFTEYADRDFRGGPNPSYGMPTGEMCFSGYINGRSVSHSWGSLDEALVGIVAYKRDGCNSQAGYLFIKATVPRDGSDINPETRKCYYAATKSDTNTSVSDGTT